MAVQSRIVVVLFAALLIAGVSTPLLAQPASGIDNQRFFTTPDERQRLDALRQGAKKLVEKKVAAKKTPPPAPLPRVEVHGIVVRSRGPNAAWVNGGNTLRGDSVDGGLRVQVDAHGQARVLLPNRGSVALRPGQSYDPASGKTTGIHIRKNP
ncbi:MAG: hypothetical protein OET44_04720 [Gammaproteobacteria bacterium]|nr:hypothetical protein [Gammaproteobacteria bacterium]